ncbi:hypothetical protein [Hoyosella subflava]|uniref:hypothetical protein n=1 Tax=Hoyosella subflava TaxID=639313 RepID=UPI0011D205CF|nr:hypothetical protein [Hoyosella subflava]
MRTTWAMSDICSAHYLFEDGGTNASGNVAGLVSAAFPAYARILHPAYRRVSEATSAAPASFASVRWTTVAKHSGAIAHPAMEWEAISAGHRDPETLVWDVPPSTGRLPSPEQMVLAGVLEDHTSTPERCWFAFAEARGLTVPPDYPRIITAMGPMIVFCGAVLDAGRTFQYESPNLWWPEDRRWCVASDIDLMATYVGGSLACIEDLLASPSLEAMPAKPDQKITIDADTVNPPPPQP